MINLKKRIKGGLYGQALGDSLSMPAGFRPRPPGIITGIHHKILDGPAETSVHFTLKAGQVNDVLNGQFYRQK